MRCGGSALGNSDTTVTLDGTAKIVGVSRTIPAGTMRIEIWIYRSSGSADIDVYAIWGGPEEYSRLAWPQTRRLLQK